jgi:hypothetical protein
VARDGYLGRVLADATRPFVHRGRVARLLGLWPYPDAGPILSPRAPLPQPGFPRPAPPPVAQFELPDELFRTGSAVVDAADPSGGRTDAAPQAPSAADVIVRREAATVELRIPGMTTRAAAAPKESVPPRRPEPAAEAAEERPAVPTRRAGRSMAEPEPGVPQVAESGTGAAGAPPDGVAAARGSRAGSVVAEPAMTASEPDGQTGRLVTSRTPQRRAGAASAARGTAAAPGAALTDGRASGPGAPNPAPPHSAPPQPAPRDSLTRHQEPPGPTEQHPATAVVPPAVARPPSTARRTETVAAPAVPEAGSTVGPDAAVTVPRRDAGPVARSPSRDPRSRWAELATRTGGGRLGPVKPQDVARPPDRPGRRRRPAAGHGTARDDVPAPPPPVTAPPVTVVVPAAAAPPLDPPAPVAFWERRYLGRMRAGLSR